MFAELNIALGDAAIVAWNAKFTYNLWRPVTAIRGGDTNSNEQTTADSTWTSLLITPNFPEYLSGHSTYSAAAATVLKANFGGSFPFSTTSYGLPGVTLSFNSFDQAADEAGRSRIYGGIHYEFTNQASLAAGRSLGSYVVDTFAVSTDELPPIPIAALDAQNGLVTAHNMNVTGHVLDNLSGVKSLQCRSMAVRQAT